MKMIKFYYVEVKVGNKWLLLQTFTKHTDALHNVKERSGEERYPMRIVRVVRTIIFSEENKGK